MVAKHHADRILEESNLTYTIVRPGGLTNEVGTGKITAETELDTASIPREDVATTIVTALTEEHTFQRSFELVTGETSIANALKNI